MEDSYTTKNLFSRLMTNYVKKHSHMLWGAVTAMVIVAFTNGANAYIIRPLLDDIFFKKDANMLPIITFAVLFTSIVKGIALYFENFIMKKLGQSIIIDMQIDLYKHLVASDLKFLQKYSSGKLISRFSVDIIAMKSTVSTILAGFARDVVSLVALVAVMFYQNWFLSLLVFTVFPVSIYPIILLGKRMRKVAGKTQEELSNYTVQLDETFQKIRIIKSFVRETFELSRANSIISNILKLYIKAARVEALSSPLMGFITGIAIAFVTWYGGTEVIAGHTTPGSFFSFITAFLMAYKPVKTLTDLNTNLQEGLAAAKRYFTLMDIKPEVVDAPGATDLEIKKADIVFEDVTFSYVPGAPVLEHFNLHIPAGKKVAIVGESGSGKSTLTNLLLRFYDIDSGKILIDNQEISAATIHSLRESISIVTQETALFDDTIKHNMMYGNFFASDEKVLEVARFAMISDFAEYIEHKYDFRIGQNGMNLSGGQRQRIAIARAMLKNSPIMILDEATSALDNITEAKVVQNISNMRKGLTTIIIAHRLSTIIDSDVIYVMKDGKLIESGTHNELMEKGGHYKNLYNKEQID